MSKFNPSYPSDVYGKTVEIDSGPEHPFNGDCGKIIGVEMGGNRTWLFTVKFEDGNQTVVTEGQLCFYD